jgi:hypothetical protein
VESPEGKNGKGKAVYPSNASPHGRNEGERDFAVPNCDVPSEEKTAVSNFEDGTV